MQVTRDTIFIGHANPEDNEFTLWLYHKLTNEGYKVACDLVNLTGGESDFWKTLQDILENQTCKYLLVFSKTAFSKQGVIDEWEQVRAIGKRENIKDFVGLVKIDDVPFDQRIGTVTMNQFRFDKSWASGLRNLTKKLHLDSIPKQNSSLSLNNWLKNKFTDSSAGLIKKREKFHSNWIKIVGIPESIHFFKYSNEKQAEAILKEVDTFPVIRHDDYLITFLEELPTQSLKYDLTIEPKTHFSVSTRKCHEYFSDNTFPNFHDLRRFLVRLLKSSFSIYLNHFGLLGYELSGKNSAYYYPKDFRPENRVFFEFEGKRTRKDLVGIYYETSFWHYAVSFRPLFHPFFCFSIKSHIVFSNDGIKTWEDKDEQHSARRNKGKRFYNAEWRAMLLAFLHSLNETESIIKLPGNPSVSVEIEKCPIEFYSKIGYTDPEKGREVPIDFYDDEEGDKDDNFETEYEGE
jgi:hypothetical protein